MSRPRILLTTRTHFRTVEIRREDSVTGRNYSQALALAGALPLLAPNLEPELAGEFLEGIDGVLFSGGSDLDPAFYGQQPALHLGEVDRHRDEFELALYRAARARELPILGICRGLQLINVAEGGTLHQHLPDVPGTIQHLQVNLDGVPSQSVTLEPDSPLGRHIGRAELRVNSYHHQAIDRLASGLEVVARAADGIIEAVAGTSGAPLLAVQWHPEMSFAKYPEHLAPFQWLVEHAARREVAVTPQHA